MGKRRSGSVAKSAGAITKLLTDGDRRKLQNVDLVVDLVLRSPERGQELLELVFSGDEIVRMLASDALEKVSRQKPELLEPYIERLLTDLAANNQPSVQWHLAQILGEVSLDKEQTERARRILRRYLSSIDDWIVINLSLQTLAGFARDDPAAKRDLISVLRRHQGSRYKSVVSRVKKLLAEFGG